MQPIISSHELLSLVEYQPVLFVDARGGPDAYQRYLGGHLPGAIFVDLETELSTKGDDPAQGGRHPLPHPGKFAQLLSSIGVTPEMLVVVYDDKGGSNAAARFWWMAKAIGHRTVVVLDGGYQAGLSAGMTAATDVVPRQPTSHVYAITNWSLPIVSLEDVQNGLHRELATVIDVRESYRYRGESEPLDLVAGHIPGAINIPYLENLSGEGKFHSPEYLREKYAPLFEADPAREIIVHCGSGVTACHTLLAMELAGLASGKLYPGSWSEWSRNCKPIATGVNPL